MSRIRAKNTKPELIVRRYLFSRGYRYRINLKSLPGSPDIVFRKLRTVIFVNGCFWHGHDACSMFKLPKTNTDWWRTKIRKNKIRDRKKNILLKQQGWHVITIWECQLSPKKRMKTLFALDILLKSISITPYLKHE